MFINAVGYYIPENRIPNEYFLNLSGLSSEWIYQRTGIMTRAKAAEKESINDMSLEAVKKAVTKLPYSIKDVDLVIFASYTPSDTVGTTAHFIQREFNIEHARAFYLSSACSSALNAMEIIKSFMASGISSKALLIMADRNSTYSNEKDSQSGHLWGDAAAAFFFSKEKMIEHEAEIIDVFTQGLGHIGKGPEGVNLNPKNGGLYMGYGKDIFVQACIYMTENTNEILAKNHYKLTDLSYFIGHQANIRILNNVTKRLDISEEKCLSNIQELGNTGSVSAFLVYAQNEKQFVSGDLICLTVFGGGYSSGACLIKIS